MEYGKDIVTGEVLGDHMADRMTKELVINAILAMLAKHKLKKGCIFHSDRGSQYNSNAVMGLLKQYGLCQSFSRVGVPGDNANRLFLEKIAFLYEKLVQRKWLKEK